RASRQNAPGRTQSLKDARKGGGESSCPGRRWARFCGLCEKFLNRSLGRAQKSREVLGRARGALSPLVALAWPHGATVHEAPSRNAGMKFFARLLMPLALTAVLLGGLSRPADAAIVQAFTRADVSPTETFLWSTLGPDLTFVGNGTTFATVSGGLTTFSQASPNATRFSQFPAGGYQGNFAPGDALLYTSNALGLGGSGPMALDFSTPVSGVAFQIQPNYLNTGPFDAQIQVFAADDTTLLATFTRSGNSNGNADNSAMV